MSKINIYKIIFAGVMVAGFGAYIAMAQFLPLKTLQNRYILTFENMEDPPQKRLVMVACPPGQAEVKEIFGPASWVDYDVFEIEPLRGGETVRAVVSLINCYPPKDFSLAIFDETGDEVFTGSVAEGNVSLEPELVNEFRAFLGLR